jgi:lipid II:glycine glycyltransferase (peptidoglycan interpeptide bridge formation enzyme)
MIDMQKEVTEKTLDAVATHPLQTWTWGEFREKWGNEVVRFPFGQITVHKLYFLPFKVAVFDKGPRPTRKMINTLREYASKNNILFVKIEPNVVKNKADISLLKEAGAVPGKTLFTPSTFIIDLTKTEDELLKSFTQKTRYNIRLAAKKGVTVTEDNTDKAFQTYWKLSKETAKRQGFFVHTKRYHELMWETLHKANIAHMLTAQYNKKTLVSWVLFVWKDTLYYPYGASSDEFKNVMAPNLMMWEAIKLGKKLKLKKFDLWGREEGKGFTKFKEGYNPEVVEFLGTWDLICSPFYWVYRIAEWVRWKILRLKAKFV